MNHTDHHGDHTTRPHRHAAGARFRHLVAGAVAMASLVTAESGAVTAAPAMERGAHPEAVREGRASWTPSQPPQPEQPDRNVPYVISGQVNDAHQRYRADARWKLDVAPGHYVQTFANRNGSHLLTVRTIVPRPDDIVEPIPGRIGPWKLYDGSGEYLGLTLSNGNIAVFLSSNWLDWDQLRALAADISQRPQGEPGWDIDELPDDAAPVGEGYWWRGDPRTDIILDRRLGPIAQVDVYLGDPGQLFGLPPDYPLGRSRIVDFDGMPALFVGPVGYNPDDTFVSLRWEREPGVYVRFRTRGDFTPRELVDHARAVISTKYRGFWRTKPLLPPDRCLTFDC